MAEPEGGAPAQNGGAQNGGAQDGGGQNGGVAAGGRPIGAAETRLWAGRVLEAIGRLDDGPGAGALPEEASSFAEEDVAQEVAACFADRFRASDYVYEGGRPHWRRGVDAAVTDLLDAGRLERTRQGRLRPTGPTDARPTNARPTGTPPPVGAEQAPPARTPEQRPEKKPEKKPVAVSSVISTPLQTSEGRSNAGVDEDAADIMVELNLTHPEGPAGALRRLELLWRKVTDAPGPERLSDAYATGRLTVAEMKRLVAADSATEPGDRAVYRIWPDFAVRKLIDATAMTVKAEPAQRSFNAFGQGVVWAVIDSGIDAAHRHFTGFGTLTDPAVTGLHRSFLPDGPDGPDDPLRDEDGHGTHVAGIIAGGLHPLGDALGPDDVVVTQAVFNVENPDEPLRAPRPLADPGLHLNGMAPRTALVSLKVLGGGGPAQTRVSRVIAALAYVREVNAASDPIPRIHGVNLSLGYDFDPTWFACGQSPLCLEVDKLVRSGVVVVVAAGNSGYGTLNPTLSTVAEFGMGVTINDPGNAERAITVGATHRDAPHRYGVSYFSSKGPTGDGRAKPDLVAPGERIVSAAAGANRAAVALTDAQKEAAVYVEDTGTSMAAPHVSGAVAAFLSVNREFIGRPERVKEIFVGSATDLGRDRYFQGGGLLDLMRALQSV